MTEAAFVFNIYNGYLLQLILTSIHINLIKDWDLTVCAARLLSHTTTEIIMLFSGLVFIHVRTLMVSICAFVEYTLVIKTVKLC